MGRKNSTAAVSIDQEVISSVGIQVMELHRWLDISRPTLYAMLEAGEGGSRKSSLSKDHWGKIYGALITTDPTRSTEPRAPKLRALLLSELEFDVALHHTQSAEDVTNREIWIFAIQPLELLDPLYLEHISKYFYESNTGALRLHLTYFLPDERAADELAELKAQKGLRTVENYARRFATKQPSDMPGTVRLVVAQFVRFMPHFSIVNPRTRPTGHIVDSLGTRPTFRPCPHLGVQEVVKNFRLAGVGLPGEFPRLFPVKGADKLEPATYSHDRLPSPMSTFRILQMPTSHR